MNTEENKQIMAHNIQRYMDQRGISRQQLCDALDIKYTTLRDWLKGITYPRIGKVEAMANYFGCEKSDLIEDKSSEEKEKAPGEELTEGEKALIELFRRVPEESQQLVLGMIRAALNTDK